MKPTFKEWMKLVDNELMSIAGLGHDDLTDFAYWDAWDDGVDPHEVAIDVLYDNDFPMEL